VIDEEAVALFDAIDGKIGGSLILDAIAGIELHANERSGGKDILPHFFGGGKADFHAVTFDRNDKSKSKLWL
jgi:hypothetical protein